MESANQMVSNHVIDVNKKTVSSCVAIYHCNFPRLTIKYDGSFHLGPYRYSANAKIIVVPPHLFSFFS